MTASAVEPFVGVHCETVATGTLLRALGCELSEAMLFGLGEALGFVFLNLSSLPLPFVGGRSKPFALTERACHNLGFTCHVEETTSRAKASSRLEVELAKGRPVGLQLDCYYLPYFKHAPHFAGHFVAAIGLNGDQVSVVDTVQQGTLQSVSRSQLEAARLARGPMAAKARMYTIADARAANLSDATRVAIQRNATCYLTPDFSGMGAAGITKLAKSLPGWIERSGSPGDDLRLAASLMERAGTGGALFRNLYCDFLAQAVGLLPRQAATLGKAHAIFVRAAELWTNIARLIDQTADDGRIDNLKEAAGLCLQAAAQEDSAMKLLARM